VSVRRALVALGRSTVRSTRIRGGFLSLCRFQDVDELVLLARKAPLMRIAARQDQVHRPARSTAEVAGQQTVRHWKERSEKRSDGWITAFVVDNTGATWSHGRT
jgi:hypothetical protein